MKTDKQIKYLKSLKNRVESGKISKVEYDSEIKWFRSMNGLEVKETNKKKSLWDKLFK